MASMAAFASRVVAGVPVGLLNLAMSLAESIATTRVVMARSPSAATIAPSPARI